MRERAASSILDEGGLPRPRPAMGPRSLTLAALGTLAPLLHAQGDECQGAPPITLGDTPFDTTLATPSAGPWIWPCGQVSGADVWFEFTAPEAGAYTAETCGATAYDTAVLVARGTCGALVPDQCSDDHCGVQSLVRFTAEAGEQLFVRVGGRFGVVGPGVLTLRRNVPVANPTNGHHYLVVGGVVDWHTARQRAEALTFRGHRGHLATLTDATEDQFVHFLLDGGPLGVVWHGAVQDLGAAGYSEPLGAWTWVTGEPWVYTNWLSSEPNDTLGLEHFGGYWPAERWNDFLVDSPSITGYVVEFETGPVGAPTCSPAVSNSTGRPAELRATGRVEVWWNELRLAVTDLPPGSFGLFFVGEATTFVAHPGGSQGNLCVSAAVGRYLGPGQIQAASASGELALDIDTTRIPSSMGPRAATPGQTLHFQCWYRDANPVPASNFTSALAVTFR